ncbi:hypothetical protein ACIPSA_38110 [Streptomyces sp. NPDC086549]|uniref:hypothetical protein n=1 Tax=Streptomyces sp. NPDC086549 TaxID=3365752 RepID=UPI0038243F29
MTRARSTAVRALAACATTAALLTGCGVRETGVVEAGGPATIEVYPNQQQRLLLFFLTSSGHLTPVTREAPRNDQSRPDAGTVDGRKLLSMLFAGPIDTETAAGLHTELPRLSGHVERKSDRDGVTIVLPLAVRSLKASAVRQIVCTTAYAENGDGRAEVTLGGTDGTLPPTRC